MLAYIRGFARQRHVEAGCIVGFRSAKMLWVFVCWRVLSASETRTNFSHQEAGEVRDNNAKKRLPLMIVTMVVAVTANDQYRSGTVGNMSTSDHETASDLGLRACGNLSKRVSRIPLQV